MKAIKIILLGVAFLVFFILIGLYVIWFFYPKKELNLYVLDKTVKDFSYSNHRSLFWVLNNSRITKRVGSNYNYRKDYYGFFPLRPLSDRQYEIKSVAIEHIDSIANAYDALYYCDTYGVYFNEWFRGFKSGDENSVIDGGLNQNDFYLLKMMKEKHKLIILEYNTVGPPTSDLIKYKSDILFGIRHTDWIGKYVSNLDSSNHLELPKEIVSKYLNQNIGPWHFKGPGILLTNNSDVIILQKKIHLVIEKPFIYSSAKSQKKYRMSDKTAYLNWFEIVNCADTDEIVSNYRLILTHAGDSVLRANNLPSSFPAIIAYQSNGANLFYFAGDFANNKVAGFYAKLANSRKFLARLTSDERKLFFYNFYFPLMESILKNNSSVRRN